jgi:uncharacterized membrane protein YdjX (TVP38/TMEM64 family)
LEIVPVKQDMRAWDIGRPVSETPPCLAEVFVGIDGAGPTNAERRWVNELRARLGHDPADAAALDDLAGPRFRDLCETLGITPNEGRERLFGSLPHNPSPATRPAVAQGPPPPDDAAGRLGASRSASRRWVVAAVVVALAAAVAVLPVREWLVAFLGWSRGLGVWGPIALAGLYGVACVLFLPGSLLTLGAGFAFGLVRGLLAAMAGSLLGAAAAFLLGRTVARRWVEGRVAANPRFRAVDEAVGREGFKIVLLTRLSPVFPFNLLNYAFGVTRVSFRDYFFASWLGMFPGTVMYVYLGSAAQSLAELAAGSGGGATAQRVLLGVGLLATVAVTVVITRIARRALRGAIGAQG